LPLLLLLLKSNFGSINPLDLTLKREVYPLELSGIDNLLLTVKLFLFI